MAQQLREVDKFGAYIHGELKFYPWRHYRWKEQWMVRAFKKGRASIEEYGVIALSPDEAVDRARKLFQDQLKYEDEQRQKQKQKNKVENHGRTEGTSLRRILPQEHQLAS